MPPWNELWELFRCLLAPAAGISLAVMLAIRLFGGEKWAALASALAVLGGVLAANHWREAMPIRFDEDRPLSCGDLVRVLGWSLEGKPTGSADDSRSLDNFGSLPTDVPQVSPRYWLPWLAILAIGIELLAGWPRFSPGAVSAARAFVSLMAGRLLTPTYFRVDYPWASWALGFVIFAEWNIVTILARKWRDGTTAAALALCCAAAAVTAMHAHSLRFTDIALFFFAALIGPAAIAQIWPTDTSPGLAGVAVFLPGLMFVMQQETFSQVPLWSFLLVGLAPLFLAPMLFLKSRRWCGIALCLAPLAAAVFMAIRAETLQF